MPRLSVPLTDEQHQAIKAKSDQTGVPQAEVARRFLLAWVQGLRLPEPAVPTKARCPTCDFELNTGGNPLAELYYLKGEQLTCRVCKRPMEWVE